MISLPTSIQIIKDPKNNNQSKTIIEPLYPGYGQTVGNALRRALLSSLPGAAVVGVKIKGASHEFSSLPKVAEDVLEIILNLKRLRLKIFNGETEKLILKIKGQKEVTAGDIAKNSNVLIVNPDCFIATLTDSKAELEMEILVAKGMGYQPVEEREEKVTEIGVIAIDAIYTPIQKVGYEVDNVRVGKRTDYDKLVLNIETDGSISASEAIQAASEIILDHFQFIKEALKPVETPIKEKEKKQKNKKPENSRKSDKKSSKNKENSKSKKKDKGK